MFLGPFLTRSQVARLLGLSPEDVALHPDLIRLRGLWLEEVYFAFQFEDDGLNVPMARLVRTLKSRWDDETIADWLVKPDPTLGHACPLDRVRRGGRLSGVGAAGKPEADEPPPSPDVLAPPSPVRSAPRYPRLAGRTPGWAGR